MHIRTPFWPRWHQQWRHSVTLNIDLYIHVSEWMALGLISKANILGNNANIVSLFQGQWCGALMFSLIWVWTNGCINRRDAGELRRHCAYHDVTVIWRYVKRPLCQGAKCALLNISTIVSPHWFLCAKIWQTWLWRYKEYCGDDVVDNMRKILVKWWCVLSMIIEFFSKWSLFRDFNQWL